MEKTSHWAALYFVALMTFGNYVLFNLLVAILVEGFSSEVSRPLTRYTYNYDIIVIVECFKTFKASKLNFYEIYNNDYINIINDLKSCRIFCLHYVKWQI